GLLGTQLSVDCIFVVLISDQTVARGYVIDGLIRPAMGLWHTGGGKPQRRSNDLVSKPNTQHRHFGIQYVFSQLHLGVGFYWIARTGRDHYPAALRLRDFLRSC